MSVSRSPGFSEPMFGQCSAQIALHALRAACWPGVSVCSKSRMRFGSFTVHGSDGLSRSMCDEVEKCVRMSVASLSRSASSVAHARLRSIVS